MSIFAIDSSGGLAASIRERRKEPRQAAIRRTGVHQTQVKNPQKESVHLCFSATTTLIET